MKKKSTIAMTIFADVVPDNDLQQQRKDLAAERSGAALAGCRRHGARDGRVCRAGSRSRGGDLASADRQYCTELRPDSGQPLPSGLFTAMQSFVQKSATSLIALIGQSIRIGIARDANRLLQFYLRGSPFVSGPRLLTE
jgi:hypothetical protein